MERARLQELLARFPELKIAVVGDFFLDKWLEIDRSLEEASVETGLPAWQVVAVRPYAGAAGTVLSNLAALEVGSLTALGLVGDDGEGFELRRILTQLGVNIGHLVVSREVMTPTYTKPMFNWPDGRREEGNRLDHKNVHPTPRDIEDIIIASLRAVAPRVDAIIALDQLTEEGHGVLTLRVRAELSRLGAKNPDLLLYADSRAFTKEFKNLIVKCNDIEVLRLFHPDAAGRLPVEVVGECLEALSRHTGRRVFVTCGEKGVLVQQLDGPPRLVPTIPQEGDIDIVGAGDACTAGIVSALCASASAGEAAEVGNLVASITIQQMGTTGVATRPQVLARWQEYYGGHE